MSDSARPTPLTDAELQLYDAGMGRKDPNSFEFVDPDFARKLERSHAELMEALEMIANRSDIRPGDNPERECTHIYAQARFALARAKELK